LKNQKKDIDDYFELRFKQLKSNISNTIVKCEYDFSEILDEHFDNFLKEFNTIILTYQTERDNLLTQVSRTKEKNEKYEKNIMETNSKINKFRKKVDELNTKIKKIKKDTKSVLSTKVISGKDMFDNVKINDEINFKEKNSNNSFR